jgi:hypothetical protein
MKTLKNFTNFINETVGNFELKKLARNLYSEIKSFGFKMEIQLDGNLSNLYQNGKFVAKNPGAADQNFKTPIKIIVDESGKNNVSKGQPVCAIVIPKSTIANQADGSTYATLAKQKAGEINNKVLTYLKNYPDVERMYDDKDWCYVIFLRLKSNAVKTEATPTPSTAAATPTTAAQPESHAAQPVAQAQPVASDKSAKIA